MSKRMLLQERIPDKKHMEALRVGKPDDVSDYDWCGENEMSIEEWRGKWGVPDWRKKDDYPSEFLPEGKKLSGKTKLSQDQWRWEFLRRDSDYRETWEPFLEGQLPTLIEGKAKTFNILGDDEGFRLDEKRFDCLGIYDLSCIIDPSQKGHELPEKFFVRRNQGRRIIKESSGEVMSFLQDTRYALFAFDVARPLAQQVARVRRRLDLLQKQTDEAHIKLPPPETLRRYLQVLDAMYEHAPIKEVGQILYHYDKRDYNKAQTRYNKDMREALAMWERL